MKKISKITIKRIPDNDCDLSWIGTFSNEAGPLAIKHDGGSRSYPYFNSANATSKREAQQDYDRMMQFENGNVSMYGVRAEAETLTSQDGKTWKIDAITSGGLWGLESDNDEKYFTEEEDNQLDDLTITLKEYGFTAEEIAAAPIIRTGFNS